MQQNILFNSLSPLSSTTETPSNVIMPYAGQQDGGRCDVCKSPSRGSDLISSIRSTADILKEELMVIILNLI